jgi:hypothetical protein
MGCGCSREKLIIHIAIHVYERNVSNESDNVIKRIEKSITSPNLNKSHICLRIIVPFWR